MKAVYWVIGFVITFVVATLSLNYLDDFCWCIGERTDVPVPIKVAVLPPHEVAGYPFDKTTHSFPLVFEVDISSDEEPEGGCCAQAGTSLVALHYYLAVDTDESLILPPSGYCMEVDCPETESMEGPLTAIDDPVGTGGSLAGGDFGPPSDSSLSDLLSSGLSVCGAHFFSGTVNLEGYYGPGRLRVWPRLHVPESASNLRICVALEYRTDTSVENCVFLQDGVLPSNKCWLQGFQYAQSRFQIEPPPGGGQLVRYRDGYLRRHFASQGRGISWTWLKEYEPDRDPIEMLWFSRVFRTPGDLSTPDAERPMKVYVPWLTPRGGKNEGAFYATNENPLLRTGLAMASLSREYIASNNEQLLSHALAQFSFIEASEWKEDGQPSGFFLRSTWPNNGRLAVKPPLYASADEIMGMMLGLHQLNRALIEAGRETDRQRLVELATRLGNRLRGSYYMIAPPLTDLLPQELHRGWAGLLAYEWFVRAALAEIVDGDMNTFAPPPWGTSVLTTTEYLRIRSMSFHPEKAENEPALRLAVEAMLQLPNMTASERARLATKATGIGLGGKTQVNLTFGIRGVHIPMRVTIPVPTLLDPLGVMTTFEIQQVDEEIIIPVPDLNNPPTFVTMTPFPTTYTTANDRWKLDFKKENRFNFPMLLHGVVMGLERGRFHDSETANAISHELELIFRGHLGLTEENPVFTELNLTEISKINVVTELDPTEISRFNAVSNILLSDDLPVGEDKLLEEASSAVMVAAFSAGYGTLSLALGIPPDPTPVMLASIFVLKGIELSVGNPEADGDYYAAAVALAPGLLQSDDDNLRMLATDVVRDTFPAFHQGLPVGERLEVIKKVQDNVGGVYPMWSTTNDQNPIIPDHDPSNPKKIGTAFAWEATPGGRVLQKERGGNGGGGLYETHILDTFKRGLDVMQEGAGIGLSLPSALLANELPPMLREDFQMATRHYPFFDWHTGYLPGCVSDPMHFGIGVGSQKCEWPWPEWGVAPSDEDKDSWHFAKELDCGISHESELDHSTTLGRSGTEGRLRRAAAVEYTRQGGITIPVWDTDDVDYFKVDCNAERPLGVTLTVPVLNDWIGSTHHRLIVDGREVYTEKDGNNGIAVIEVPSGGLHWVVVTGDKGEYTLRAEVR